MTNEDRRAIVSEALTLLEEHYQRPVSADTRETWVTMMLEAWDGWGHAPEELIAAVRYHLSPPWPTPRTLHEAHGNRVERENAEAQDTLADQLLTEPPSERRDTILRELGYSKFPPTSPPKHRM